MQYSTSFLIVNGIWRELLIVTSAEPIPEYPSGIVTDTGDYYETVYYTDGLFRSFVEGEKHVNWYLIRSKEVKERAVVALQEENKQLKAKILAQEQSSTFLEDCLIEMASVVYA